MRMQEVTPEYRVCPGREMGRFALIVLGLAALGAGVTCGCEETFVSGSGWAVADDDGGSTRAFIRRDSAQRATLVVAWRFRKEPGSVGWNSRHEVQVNGRAVSLPPAATGVYALNADYSATLIPLDPEKREAVLRDATSRATIPLSHSPLWKANVAPALRFIEGRASQ